MTTRRNNGLAGALSHGGISRSCVVLSECAGTIPLGRVTAIIGPSGAGKSTLMTIVAGRSYGPGIRRRVAIGTQGNIDATDMVSLSAYVEQRDDDNITGGATPREVLLFRCDMLHVLDETERQRRVADVIGALDLEACCDRALSVISGGERRRLSIALQLLSRRRVLFMDEPTSGLDSSLCDSILATARRVNRLLGVTVVMVIHQPSLHALTAYIDHLLVVSAGMLVYQGTPVRAHRAMLGAALSHGYVYPQARGLQSTDKDERDSDRSRSDDASPTSTSRHTAVAKVQGDVGIVEETDEETDATSPRVAWTPDDIISLVYHNNYPDAVHHLAAMNVLRQQQQQRSQSTRDVSPADSDGEDSGRSAGEMHDDAPARTHLLSELRSTERESCNECDCPDARDTPVHGCFARTPLRLRGLASMGNCRNKEHADRIPCRPSWSARLGLLLRRDLRLESDWVQATQYAFKYVVMPLVIAVSVGRVDDERLSGDESTVKARSLISMAVLWCSLDIVWELSSLLPRTVPGMLKDHEDGLYGPLVFLVAKNLADAILRMPLLLFFGTSVYLITGMRAGVQAMAVFLAALTMLSVAARALCFACTCWLDVRRSVLALSVLMSCVIVMAGVYTPLGSMSVLASACSYLSFMTYGVSILIRNQFDTPDDKDVCDRYAARGATVLLSFAALACMAAGAFVLAYALLAARARTWRRRT